MHLGLRIIFFITIASLISGCAWVVRDYLYISLTNVDGIEVVGHKKMSLKGLFNNSQIPTRYRLKRDQYTLYFSISPKSYYPNMQIELYDSEADYAITYSRDVSIKSKRGVICSSYHPDKTSHTRLEFAWSGECIRETGNQVISLSIVSHDNAVIAQEKILFTLVQDGRYVLFDVL